MDNRKIISQAFADQIDTMLGQHTEEFMWALANAMGERVTAIREEAALPNPLAHQTIERYAKVQEAAYDFAKAINPRRA